MHGTPWPRPPSGAWRSADEQVDAGTEVSLQHQHGTDQQQRDTDPPLRLVSRRRPGIPGSPGRTAPPGPGWLGGQIERAADGAIITLNWFRERVLRLHLEHLLPTGSWRPAWQRRPADLLPFVGKCLNGLTRWRIWDGAGCRTICWRLLGIVTCCSKCSLHGAAVYRINRRVVHLSG